MPPILVEPLSEQAYELLRQLEALHILRVVQEAPAAPPRLSAARFIGSLSAESAEKLLAETSAMRAEWERQF